MKCDFPWSKDFPAWDDKLAWLELRQGWLYYGSLDEICAAQVKQMCREDPLFYMNVFGFVQEPRPDDPMAGTTLMFLMYPFQMTAMKRLIAAYGERDLVIDKSRDMGASWLFIFLFDWAARFLPGQNLLMISRNEDYVDKTGNNKALFQKLDFIDSMLPQFLRSSIPRAKLRSKMHVEYPETDSVIDGESTTGNAARGDRRTCVLIDEFAAFDTNDGYNALASTRDVTKNRFFNSTRKFGTNAFNDIREQACKPGSKIDYLRMHWTDHPSKSKGLYQFKDGMARPVFFNSELPEDYAFRKDGKIRSPWYDYEEGRCANLIEMAVEVDMEDGGSAYEFFESSVFIPLTKERCRDPEFVGDIVIGDCDIVGLTPNPQGHLRMWIKPDKYDCWKPPCDANFVFGVDIATGTGASNSVIVGSNLATGEKLVEYTDPNIKPDELAHMATALCKLFKGPSGSNAYLIWEGNGPGMQFYIELKKNLCMPIFYRKDENNVASVASLNPGWQTGPKNKGFLLGEYRRALKFGEFKNYSKESYEECVCYIRVPNGDIVHRKSIGSIDPSGARSNHGDRVIADALCWWYMRELGVGTIQKQEVVVEGPNKNTMAGRMALREKARRDAEYDRPFDISQLLL